MAIREMINQRPKISGAITAVVILAAVTWLILWTRTEGVDRPAQAYFTVDDGKTFFADDVTQIPPFQHDGREAVQCYVFRGDGQPFVGYLMKYPPEVKQEMAAYQSAGREYPGVPPAALVKKPGDKDWVAVGSSAGAALMHVYRPNQPDTPAEMVFP